MQFIQIEVLSIYLLAKFLYGSFCRTSKESLSGEGLMINIYISSIIINIFVPHISKMHKGSSSE